MLREITDRLKRILELCVANNGSLTRADFDEIKILHSRTRSAFPDEFNVLLDTEHYSTSKGNLETCTRLLRILSVVESLPEDIQRISTKGGVDNYILLPTFKLDQSDKTRILELCSEMRKIVFLSSSFDEPHRVRLLNRIASIESETHKPKGMFDVVLGGIVDVGETLGKFGTSIKPLTDRMSEVAKIARRGTKEYDQLPPPDDIKQLPPPRHDETSL